MSSESVGIIFRKILDIYAHQIPMMIGLAMLFTGLALWKSQHASPIIIGIWWT